MTVYEAFEHALNKQKAGEYDGALKAYLQAKVLDSEFNVISNSLEDLTLRLQQQVYHWFLQKHYKAAIWIGTLLIKYVPYYLADTFYLCIDTAYVQTGSYQHLKDKSASYNNTDVQLLIHLMEQEKQLIKNYQTDLIRSTKRYEALLAEVPAQAIQGALNGLPPVLDHQSPLVGICQNASMNNKKRRKLIDWLGQQLKSRLAMTSYSSHTQLAYLTYQLSAILQSYFMVKPHCYSSTHVHLTIKQHEIAKHLGLKQALDQIIISLRANATQIKRQQTLWQQVQQEKYQLLARLEPTFETAYDYLAGLLNAPKPLDSDLDQRLYIASKQSCLQVVAELVKSGANVNAKTTTGWTPLTRAINHRQWSTANFLLVQGADANSLMPTGETPLMVACGKSGNYLAALQLLQAGANSACQAEDGMTALLLACVWDRLEIAHLLLHYGADPFVQDKQGNNAYWWAHYNNNPQLEQLLSQHKNIEESEPNPLTILHLKQYYTFFKPASIKKTLDQQPSLTSDNSSGIIADDWIRQSSNILNCSSSPSQPNHLFFPLLS